jgi:hypothetical protein
MNNIMNPSININDSLVAFYSSLLNATKEINARYSVDNKSIMSEHLKSIDVKNPTNNVLLDAIDIWVEKGTFPTIDDLALHRMTLCHCPYIVMGTENKEVKELYKQYMIKTIKDGQDLSCTIVRYAFLFYVQERRFPSYDELRTFAQNTVNAAAESFMSEPADKHWIPGKIETVEKIKKECCSVCDKDEEEKCSICYDNIKKGDKIITLPCKHKFHFGKEEGEENEKEGNEGEDDDSCDGITEWLKKNNTCPICKTKID